MKLSAFVFLFTFVSSFALAAPPKLPVAANFKGGKFLCAGEYAPLIKHENGVFVSVPVDYSDVSAGTTEVYAFVAGGKLNPALPTVLYFTGGPGQPSHWGLNLVDAAFNVILMDQRGIGCSRPATFAQAMNPRFYSSENIARDAEEIRKFFGVSAVTAYGVSYGTMPATIYGSLFPAVTRSVILEGTVFSQDKDLWESPLRRSLLQSVFDSLPAHIQSLIDSVSRTYNVPNTWFHLLGRDALLHNSGVETFRANLMNIENPQLFNRLIETARNYFEEITYEPHILFTINDTPYFMIACQEMGLALKGVSSHDALIKGKLTPVPDFENPEYCGKLGARSGNLYSALKYPLTVPTYYFQGREDSATVMSQAVAHYSQVPQGRKYLFLMEHGGHAPSMTYLKMDNAAQLEIFTQAIKGELISNSLVEQFNAENSANKWSVEARP